MVHLVVRNGSTELIVGCILLDLYGLFLEQLHQVVGVRTVLGEELVDEVPLGVTHLEVGYYSVLVSERLLLHSHCKKLAWH